MDRPPIDTFGLAPRFAELDRDQSVQGPAPYLFTGEDVLQLDVLGQTTVTLTIAGVMLTSRLELRPFVIAQQVVATRSSVQSFRFSIDSGWLQHVRVIVTAGQAVGTQTFVWLRVARGTTANAQVLATFSGGYVTANHDLYWPGGITERPTDSQLLFFPEAVGNPAAGADWAFTIPTGMRAQLISVSAVLTTSAAVANRVPRLIIDDGGAGVFFAAPAVVNETAGLAWRNSWGAGSGGPVTFDPLFVSSPIPNSLWLNQGYRVRSSTGAIDVGDQWSAIRCNFQEAISDGS